MNTEKAEQLRKKHPRFTYESFALEHLDDALRIRFRFILDPDMLFEPETTIESVDGSRVELLSPGVLEHLAFHLGLMEMMSYWKAACSPEIIVKAGFLDPQQVAWWIDLVLYGMREFFYMNQIDFKGPDFLQISVTDQGGVPLTVLRADPVRRYDGPLPQDRSLVLVSGGKDSAFTLQFLREAGQGFTCLLLNPTRAALAIADEVGCEKPIIVRRTLDPRLLALNEAGYLNGHTPFSALLAFLGVTCAVLFNYGRVVTSNERSTDEGNVQFLGSEVNHQYSKTFRFEGRFRDYAKTYLAKNVDYFSLLRPLYELQITRLFTGYPQYFDLFKSCNRNLRENSWCRRCAKCLFVFTGLYPFLTAEEMTRIFGEDLFERDDAIPLIQELTGLSRHKPFECVGTVKETLAALYLCLQQAKARRDPLPPVLQYVEAHLLPKYPDLSGLAQEILSGWSDTHYLPQEYARLLKVKVLKYHETR